MELIHQSVFYIVFSSILLQHDRSISKGCDIWRLLDHHLTMWQEGQFDVLLQEAQRYDRSLCNSFRSCAKNSNNHLVKVFTKLMLQGKVRAAVRWITEELVEVRWTQMIWL